MSEFNGFIESFSNGKITGWVSSGTLIAKIYCGDAYIADIDNKFMREDIVEAGITAEPAGFAIDVSEHISELAGKQLFSIKVDETVVCQEEYYIPNGECLIKNPFFTTSGLFSIADANVTVNHRVGMTLDRFVAPSSLKHTNGSYTRFAFTDAHSSKQFFELGLDLDAEKLDAEQEFPLELALVAKSSHISNIHVRFISSETGACLLDEPIMLSPVWDYKKIFLTSDLSQYIRSGEVKLVLRTKHYGKRFIDLSMICLSENCAKFKSPIQINGELAVEKELVKDTSNVIKNGELTTWNKGVAFPKLVRGQELADNWFVEMNKGNESKLNIAVMSDNAQIDPLAQNIQAKLGLRVRTGAIEGYARIITALHKAHLSVVDYNVNIDIEAMALNKKSLLPRIYLIARNSVKDTVVADIARKVTLNGRQTLQFSLKASQLEKVLKNQVDKPVLALAFDLVAGGDFTLFSLTMAPAENNADETEVIDCNDFVHEIAFEDDSITSQLGILKGLEAWASKEPVFFNETANSHKNELINNTAFTCEFSAAVAALKPQKMTRPSRSFPFIDIIVPVYNACDDVLLCLSALIEKTDITHRVIVINDGEDDRTAEMLAAFNDNFNHLEVITNPQNIGYTKSVNKGIKHSNAQWVVVLNSDTIVSDKWLGKLMNCAQSENNIGMVGALSNAASWQSVPRIHDESGDWHLNPLPKGLSVDGMAELIAEHSVREYPQVGVINGFCQLINMEMLDHIGLLDEVAFPVGYGEENDMCARAVKAGYKLLIADDTYIFHAKSKSFGHEKRKVLAKQGSEALKKKHPDVDWNAVTKIIRENPALVELREKMVAEFNQFADEKS
jgi:GT2 family glycosyltransferase